MRKLFLECMRYLFQLLAAAWTVGTYSSAEKAMKVVNMIQEAYASYKGIRTILTGITTNSEIVIAVANDKGKMDAITEALKEAAIFQMPQDSGGSIDGRENM
ncbi:MAG: hypothetical protein ACLVBP_16380 [Ruminococcus sp.]